MSVLKNVDGLNKVFVYKGLSYEEPPIKHYYIDKEKIVDGVIQVTIRKRIPMVVHILLVLLMVAPIVFVVYNSSVSSNTQTKSHTIRIPTEMYYDYTTQVLDIDIINDESNFETISFSLYDNRNKMIFEFNGVNPGEAIGSVPVDFKFDKLPMTCTIIYKTKFKDIVYKDVKRDVLIVDRAIANKDVNRDF